MKPMTERIDRRYSDKAAEAVPWTDAEARLAAAEVAWVVTVRPDGRPHATPMVPVVHEGKVYFHTGGNEVKYANLLANPHVLVLAGDTAWDRGLDVGVEGTAVPVTDQALLLRLAELYRGRWDGRWELEVENGTVVSHTHDIQVVVFAVTPDKAYGHDKGDPFSQTNYLPPLAQGHQG
jgi:nitroimidazol reductase NimA-like FMN-containing flavoprotein (pyridoxamine 5'-phosphate oxidase superfamily)